MKKGIMVGIVLCLALMMPSLSTSASAVEPIKIGVLQGFTGYMAPVAEESSRGVKLAIEKFMPTVAGRPIQLVFEDTGSKADMAVQKAKKLVERDKVSIIVGPIHGGHGMGVSAYLDKMKVPYIYACTGLASFITERDWVWITAGTLMGCTYPVGVFSYNELGYRTCTALATDREVGHEFMEGFYMSFKKLGGKVIQQQYFPPGTTQFAPYVAKLEPADFMATWIGDADAIVAFPTIREMGIKMPIVAVEHGGPILYPKAAKQIGQSLVGTITAAAYLHTIDNPTNKAFVEAYKKEYGEFPGSHTGAGFEAAEIIYNALKATNGDTTPEKLRAALLKPVDTVTGHLEWTKDRSGIHNIFIVKIQEDLDFPKILKAYKAKSEIIEKDGKKTMKYSVVE